MADITMCTNQTCPIRGTCYRAQATPGEYWQSYRRWDPKHVDTGGAPKADCDGYWRYNPREGTTVRLKR